MDVDLGRVFISHSNGDIELALEIGAALKAAKIETWIAARGDVSIGGSYADEVPVEIARARAVVVLLTAAADASIHVQNEVEIAASKNVPILPVAVDPSLNSPDALTSDLGYFLRRKQIVPLYRIEDLVARIVLKLHDLPSVPHPDSDTLEAATPTVLTHAAQPQAGECTELPPDPAAPVKSAPTRGVDHAYDVGPVRRELRT